MSCDHACLCAEVPGLQYYGALHTFLVNAPAAAASALAAAGALALSLLWTGCKLAGAAAYHTAAATLVPLGTVLAWLGWLCASHTFQIIGAVLLFTAWQVYFPSRLLIRLLAKLPYCRGVSFEFAPSPDQRSQRKYVALTINGAPCPYNSTAVLDEMKKAGAKATFFIVGSHVETCDVIGVGPCRSGGEGHFPLGQETLRRMYTEGHELGNHTWHDRPSHTLTPKQLSKEICDVHKVIQAARQAAMSGPTPEAGKDSGARAPAPVTTPRTKWFRPGGGWFTPEMVEAAQKLGYHTVLGSVYPWDIYSRWPLLNAMYICAKVQPGAVIVLHDRRRHLLPTLQYVLPWLSKMDYDVTTLSEAAFRSNGHGPELTLAALEVHNNNHSSQSLASHGSGRSLDVSAAPNMMRSYSSAGNIARMAMESERAAMEEAERQHLKALKRAEADKRAGIDRRIVDMSAAEKRAIVRREREKKEAEIRRARRKIEEAKARERYERYVKERAERHEREKQERAEAERKAKEAEERRRKAEEDYNKRKEAERKYAAEMVARQKAEREAREAEAAAAAAAAAAAGGAMAAPDAEDALEADILGMDQDSKKKKKGMSLFKKFSSKAAEKLGVREKSSSGKAATAVTAAAAAAVTAAGVAILSNGTASVTEADKDSYPEPVAAERQLPDESYGWYGRTPSPDSAAALAAIDMAVAAHAAGEQLPEPVTGSYARGADGRVLLGFDGQPLVLSVPDNMDTLEAPGAHPILLNSQGEPVIGPEGERILLLLGTNNMPLADPYGRPVFIAETMQGGLAGVHPDGTIIQVPLPSTSEPASASASTASGSGKSLEYRSAVASNRISSSSSSATSGDVVAAQSGAHHQRSVSASTATGSIKEASSYAASLARSSVRSNMSSGMHTAATGLPPLPPGHAPLSSQAPTVLLPHPSLLDAPHSTSSVAADTEQPAHTAAAAAVRSVAWVPAQLMLGPSGRPLLGFDNRPLIIAVDDNGHVLTAGAEGQPLLGPDSQPLQLGCASDGSLVALDSLCRPLVASDGGLQMVALDTHGRPVADSTGHAVMLGMGPAGFAVAGATAAEDTGSFSWGEPAVISEPHRPSSGSTGALLTAAGVGCAAGTAAAVWQSDTQQGDNQDNPVMATAEPFTLDHSLPTSMEPASAAHMANANNRDRVAAAAPALPNGSDTMEEAGVCELDGACHIPKVAEHSSSAHSAAIAVAAATTTAVAASAGMAASTFAYDHMLPSTGDGGQAAQRGLETDDISNVHDSLNNMHPKQDDSTSALLDAEDTAGPDSMVDNPSGTWSEAAVLGYFNKPHVAPEEASGQPRYAAHTPTAEFMDVPSAATGDITPSVTAATFHTDSSVEADSTEKGFDTAMAAAATQDSYQGAQMLHSRQQQEAVTPRLHPAAAAAYDDEVTEQVQAADRQQEPKAAEPVGKIRLSAQGVALTASSHSTH